MIPESRASVKCGFASLFFAGQHEKMRSSAVFRPSTMRRLKKRRRRCILKSGVRQMDAKIFGRFLADCRKEKNMTQAELAERLHVTDKAVSRWERGIGFPDINTIEPLAGALGVSVLELMKSQRITAQAVSREEAAEIVSDALQMGKAQQSRRCKGVFQSIGKMALLIFALFLVSVPLAYIFTAASLLAYETKGSAVFYELLFGGLRGARLLAAIVIACTLRKKEQALCALSEQRKTQVTAAVVVFALIVLQQSDFLLGPYYMILERFGVFSIQGCTLSLAAVVLDISFAGDLFWCILACLFVLFVPIPAWRKKRDAVGQGAQPPQMPSS